MRTSANQTRGRGGFPARRAWAAGPLAALAVLGGSGATAQAAPPPLACGDTITTATTLTRDLHCPEGGNGLVVRGDGVVLDLAGHNLTGSGWSGVVVQGRDVVVRGGTLTAWGEGVTVAPGAAAVVERVTLQGNTTGLGAHGEAVLRRATVRANSRGVVAEGGGDVSVEGSDLARNPVAVAVRDGGRASVLDTSVRGNELGLACSSATLQVRRSVVADSGTALFADDCGTSTVEGALFLLNEVNVVDAGAATTPVVFTCSRFLGGAATPATTAPCGGS
ncbi:right-handed parallel beta-helix repeat-containing protein [Kineococcus radiotolerans]|uniref:Right handed beta helix domain-containing protein n=1 Tax=Kineococcus radiotolerans (strain ATCC BAA-149 / DSM 14245 / SRS30216) TaxID=266940 RepID=A6WD68_KINRD|nr:right-handed parallel beta-helix repeat-containing protein [Kineococcus radiotolerans]ABS04757.1 hypothetical protein Krad_3293 [Kineococcus radiotolerans SRS30216 = ATCC BAA-149]